MTADNRDQLTTLRAYWLQRQQFIELCTQLAAALNSGDGAQAANYVREGQALSLELTRLATATERPFDTGLLTTTLIEGLEELRQRLNNTPDVQLDTILAAMVPLTRLEVAPEIDATIHRNLMEPIAVQARMALSQKEFDRVRRFAQALSEYGVFSPLHTIDILLDLAAQASTEATPGLAVWLVEQARNLRSTQAIDVPAQTDKRLDATQAAVLLAAARAALNGGDAPRAIDFLEQMPATGDVTGERAQLLAEAHAVFAPNKRQHPWRWLLISGVVLIILAAVVGQNLLTGASAPLAANVSPATPELLTTPNSTPTTISVALSAATAQASTQVSLEAERIATQAAATITAIVNGQSTAAVPLLPLPTATALPSEVLAVTLLDDLRGRLIRDQVALYDDPVASTRILAILPINSELYFCALAGNRYLVAFDRCDRATPIGWITQSNIEPFFQGRFPDILTTPLPTATP